MIVNLKNLNLQILVLSIFNSSCSPSKKQNTDIDTKNSNPNEYKEDQSSVKLPSLGQYQGPYKVNPANAQRKEADIYLPNNYKEKSNWPLVILLHGLGGSAQSEEAYLNFRLKVTSRGFILLIPEGTFMPEGTIGGGVDFSKKQFWNATDFCCDFAQTKVDDVGYLTALLKTVKSDFAINPKKVFIIGHSNGGFMANRLACEIGAEFRAYASLAGGSFKDVLDCHKPIPRSFLQIHAVNDHVVKYHKNTQYAGGLDSVDQWLKRNDCTENSVQKADRDYLLLVPGNDIEEQIWQDCSVAPEVRLWTIREYIGKGHSPHIPIFKPSFLDAVLDFFFEQ
jgi:polyhydroxybutyrate depolymerase